MVKKAGDSLGDLSAIAKSMGPLDAAPDLEGFEPSPTNEDGTTRAREEPSAETDPEPAPEPKGDETFEVNYSGQMLNLTREELISYAQKGFDYETKMAKLKEQKDGFDSFQAWESYLDQRPDLKDLWLTLCDQYEQHGQKVPRLVFDEESEVPGEGDDPKIAVLQGRIDNLENLIKNQGAEEESEKAGRELIGRLQWAIEQRPYLKSVAERSVKLHGRDIVTEKLIQRLQQNPQADVQLLANAVEKELKETGETLGGGSGKTPANEGQPEPFTTVEPSASPAPGTFTPPTEGTVDDLKSGKIRRGVEAYLASRNIG